MTTTDRNANSNPHPSHPPESPDAEGLNRRAIARLSGRDVAGALNDFHRATALCPNYPEAWNNSGLALQMLGRLDEAVAAFDRALALRPEYPEALTNRGRVRQALGDPDAALADFDRALACASGRFVASVLHNRGALRQAQGDLAGALADFDRALEIDPEHTATHVNRGTARKEAGDLSGALADFDRALAQDPSRGLAEIYHARGGVRVLQNDFAGAIADYDQALAQEPENYFFYISRGNARYHCRDGRAVVDYRVAFRIQPQGAAQEVFRLLAADVQRDAEGVLDNCVRHLRLSNRDVLACARRGLTLLLLGRDAEAAPDVARLREFVPDLAPCLGRLIDLIHEHRGIQAQAHLDGEPSSRERVIDFIFALQSVAPYPTAAIPDFWG